MLRSEVSYTLPLRDALYPVQMVRAWKQGRVIRRWATCMTSGKELNLAEPHFVICKMGVKYHLPSFSVKTEYGIY